MYMPKVARFTSRDPFPTNGVTVLSPMPDMQRFIGARNTARLQPYVYVANSPVNHVDPSGLGPGVGAPRLLLNLYRPGPQATSTLPCSGTGNVDVCCRGDECDFIIATAYIPFPINANETGIFDFRMYMHHKPGTAVLGGLQVPQSVKDDFEFACQSDLGRTNADTGDHLTVTLLNGTPCRFRQNDFNQLTGQPTSPPPGCDGVVANSGNVQAGIPPMAYGQTLSTLQAVKSVSFKFTIETYCGCEGVDQLGRPIARMSGTLTLQGKVP